MITPLAEVTDMMRYSGLGLVLIAAVAFPAFYTSNPQLFHPAGASVGPTPDLEGGSIAFAAPEPERPATRASGRKVMVAADERGHFVAEFRLNGKKIMALVDTGATAVAINKSTAQRIGIALSAADFTNVAHTANGEARYARAVIRSIELGKIRVENVDAAVLEDKALGNVLIGMTFLNKLKSFNVTDGELALQQ
jgi:aspartyl protease family protein